MGRRIGRDSPLLSTVIMLQPEQGPSKAGAFGMGSRPGGGDPHCHWGRDKAEGKV